MKYQCKNELTQFNFNEASIVDITYQNRTLTFQLDNVTILANNSKNRDIRDMRTNELLLTFEQVLITKFVAEGYKVYDADNNLTETVSDNVVEESQYLGVFKELAGSFLYSIEERSTESCIINIDGEFQTYRLELKYQQNVVGWNRFLNKDV